MYCPKCGAKNEDNYNFCSNCSYPREGDLRTSQTQSKKENKKKINLITIIVGVTCVSLVVIVGIWLLGGKEKEQNNEKTVVSDSASNQEKDTNQGTDTDQGTDIDQDTVPETNQENDPNSDSTIPSEEPQQEEESMSATTLEDFLALVKDSKNALVVLARDPDSNQYIVDENVDESTKLFQDQMFTEYKNAFEQMAVLEDYPFIYNPEYLVYFDNDACYTVMADVMDGERVAIVQIDGNDTLYRAPINVYYNVIRTTLEDDFGFMHIFNTANDRDSAMDGAARNSLVEMYAHRYYTDMGYNFEEGVTFRIDDIVLTKMPDVDPNLYSALIQYSVKPVSTDGIPLPDNMNIYLEDGWIKGGFLVGAIWNEEKENSIRSYMLGLTTFEYDVNGQTPEEAAQILYDQSNIKNLIE